MDSKANEVAEMLECPVCGTFLEADEIDVHANAHFEPPPTERDQPAPLETVDDEKVTFDDLTTATNNSVGTGAARLDALPNGTIAIIFRLLSESADTNRAFLCHVSAKPFRDAPGQGGNWSCGYRNSQSLLASCLAVFPDLAGRVRENTGKSGVPDIVDIQRMIERAWRKGADPGGRDHFRGKLVATKEWIGGTEVAVLLNHLGLKYRVVDFHRPADAQQNHPLLLEWVAGYFGADVSDDGPTSEKVVLTSKLPLYFQHQGHSRTIVGLEVTRSGASNLLVMDPAGSRESLAAFRVSLQDLRRHRQYQIVQVVPGGYANEAERREAAHVIRPVRVPP